MGDRPKDWESQALCLLECLDKAYPARSNDSYWALLWTRFMGPSFGTHNVLLCGRYNGRAIVGQSVRKIEPNHYEVAGPPVIVPVKTDPIIKVLHTTNFVPRPTSMDIDFPPFANLILQGDYWKLSLDLHATGDKSVGTLYDVLYKTVQWLADTSGHRSLAEWRSEYRNE